MTQKQKDLLLKDLCARLPYGVKLNMKGLIGISHHTTILYGKNTEIYFRYACNDYLVEQCKPYLFPMSSMTEEQLKEYMTIPSGYRTIDWFNKNHFDYRCLIENGLAIDATGLNIY